MKLPNAQPLSAADVRAIFERVGDRERLSKALFVTRKELDQWADRGVQAGPVAACLRYLAQAHDMPPSPGFGRCVLCSAPGVREIAQTPVCLACVKNVTTERLRPLGMASEELVGGFVVTSERAFERPTNVKLHRPGARPRTHDHQASSGPRTNS